MNLGAYKILLKLNKWLILIMVVLISTITACGKKDENFKIRNTETHLGVRPAAGLEDHAALDISDSQNLKIDILSVGAAEAIPSTHGIRIKVNISLNDTIHEIQTTHFERDRGNSPYFQSQRYLESQTVNYIGFCRDNRCRQYYILINISTGTQPRLQLGLKYDHDHVINRWYTVRLPERFYTHFSDFVLFMDNQNHFNDY